MAECADGRDPDPGYSCPVLFADALARFISLILR
jgi:hypothetical protein